MQDKGQLNSSHCLATWLLKLKNISSHTTLVRSRSFSFVKVEKGRSGRVGKR